MKFHVGFLDKLFGEKIELEIPDGKGNVIKRTVTKKWYEKMIQEGKISKIEEEVVKVHMLHPVDGYNVLHWVVGEDINKDTVDRFSNENGEIYAMTVFDSGEQKVVVVTKEIFDQGCEKFRQISFR